LKLEAARVFFVRYLSLHNISKIWR